MKYKRKKVDNRVHRFILIFDREGYSPDFMQRMKSKRIACLTYNKYPKEDWKEEEFFLKKVKLISGEIVDMQLAERGIFLGGKFWAREIRRLMNGGHQTSIISTAYRLDLETQAMGMFARWSLSKSSTSEGLKYVGEVSVKSRVRIRTHGSVRGRSSLEFLLLDEKLKLKK